MISYAFSQNILFIMLQGQIRYDDILSYLDKFPSIEFNNDSLRLLYDLTEAEVLLSLEEVEKLSIQAEKVTENYRSVRSAFLVNEPKNTALSTFFSKLQKSSRTDRRLFYTREAAIDWLSKGWLE
jgi:hypothetical protein